MEEIKFIDGEEKYFEIDENHWVFAKKCMIASCIFWTGGLVFNIVSSIVLIKLL